MHEVPWPGVQWLRLSWSRKDFLTACGSVLVDTIFLISSRLVSSCVVLLGPLGGRSGSSLGSLGASWGPLWALLGGIWAPGPLLGRSWPLWGRAWPAPRSSWAGLGCSSAVLGPILGRSWPLLACFGASWASLGAYWAALGSEEQIFGKTLIRLAFYGSDLACRGPKLA